MIEAETTKWNTAALGGKQKTSTSFANKQKSEVAKTIYLKDDPTCQIHNGQE